MGFGSALTAACKTGGGASNEAVRGWEEAASAFCQKFGSEKASAAYGERTGKRRKALPEREMKVFSMASRKNVFIPRFLERFISISRSPSGVSAHSGGKDSESLHAAFRNAGTSSFYLHKTEGVNHFF